MKRSKSNLTQIKKTQTTNVAFNGEFPCSSMKQRSLLLKLGHKSIILCNNTVIILFFQDDNILTLCAYIKIICKFGVNLAKNLTLNFSSAQHLHLITWKKEGSEAFQEFIHQKKVELRATI